MNASVLNVSAVAALLTRLHEQPWDAEQLALLQEQLLRQGAKLQGQLPELLLRCPNPDEAVRHWLADKDLSHWWPQTHGGTAAQGWQFETAGWNRSRGAEVMSPPEIARAHADGGMDALWSPGVASDVAGHCLAAGVMRCSSLRTLGVPAKGCQCSGPVCLERSWPFSCCQPFARSLSRIELSADRTHAVAQPN